MAFVYIVDSSSWIDLAHLYPRANFGQLWASLSGLVIEGRIKAPYQVREEISKGGDVELTEWCRQNKAMFVNDKYMIPLAADVVRRHPRLVKPHKSGEEADPFLIALAQMRNMPTF